MAEQKQSDDTQAITRDSLFDGDLTCFQHAAGYRFSIDAVLLGHFVEVHTKDRILDLGTGSGIIMMTLLYRWGSLISEISGIELQQGLADLATMNLKANGLEERGRVVAGDIKNILGLVAAESFDTVVCNPPFYHSGSGRQNDNMEARLARHQFLAGLDDFLRASAAAVRNKGTVYCVYPAEQIGRFIALADSYRLEVKKLRFVYGYPGENTDARLVLIHCRKNGGPGVKVMPPLYVYREKNGAFSDEMQNFYKKNITL
jgi:tRNA1Val (adenine37-N6)-methyltransferase